MKPTNSTRKQIRTVDRIKRLLLVAIILLIIASMLLVDIGYMFL